MFPVYLMISLTAFFTKSLGSLKRCLRNLPCSHLCLFSRSVVYKYLYVPIYYTHIQVCFLLCLASVSLLRIPRYPIKFSFFLLCVLYVFGRVIVFLASCDVVLPADLPGCVTQAQACFNEPVSYLVCRHDAIQLLFLILFLFPLRISSPNFQMSDRRR